MDSKLEIPVIPEAAIEDAPTIANESAATTPAVTGELSQIVVRPPHGWQLINVAELWHYRELLYFLTWRDVKVRYKQTVLGAAWAILQPAMMMVVFTIFFSRLAKVATGDLPYPIFAFAGLLPWTFFATSIANAGVSVVSSERLITKIYFPLSLRNPVSGSSMVVRHPKRIHASLPRPDEWQESSGPND